MKEHRTPFLAASRRALDIEVALDCLRNSGALQRWLAVEACRTNPAQPPILYAPTFFQRGMEIDLREISSQQLYVHGAIEPHLTAFFVNYLSPTDIFFDVGAHIGYFTVLAERLIGPNGAVHSFEPMPKTFERLRRNAASIPNINCHRLAAWSHAGMLSINDFGISMSAFNSITEIRMPDKEHYPVVETIEVPCVDLDSFCENATIIPSVIKIDVESAELMVLKGMTRLMRDVRPVITIEVGDFAHLRAANVATSRETIQFVSEFEYTAFEPDVQGRLHPHHLKSNEDLYSYGNVICVPNEKIQNVLDILSSNGQP